MLKEYKHKRNFAITPEPSGENKPRESRPLTKRDSLSFVVQKHAARRLHYDFRLEIDGVMVSWAVPKGPSLNPEDKRLAVMTEDHPMEYSDFEGIIPEQQYGAGEVIIWDHGIYRPNDGEKPSQMAKATANKLMRKSLKSGKLSFYLQGEKLQGRFTLIKLRNKEKDWLLIKHRDESVDEESDVTAQDASVISGRTIADLQNNGADRIWTAKGAQRANPETTGRSSKKKVDAGKMSTRGLNSGRSSARSSEKISRSERDEILGRAKKAAFPRHCAPMLATLVDAPFSADGWIFEPKLDGIRAISYIKDGKARLLSRNGIDLTEKYPAITESLAKNTGSYVFDGEVVVLDENGKPSFQYLQRAGGLHSISGKNITSKAQLVYYIFDILHLNGKDVSKLPLTDRKKILPAVPKIDQTVRLVQTLGRDGEAAFQACVDHGLEGIVGKKEDATYDQGKRTRSWLKVKTALTDEFLVCGFRAGTGARSHTFGSLILGEYDNAGKLRYVGGVGTGFNGGTLKMLMSKMKPLVTKECPFAKKPAGKLKSTWVKPELVAEIKFMERTEDHSLRAPVFLHLRHDIEPATVHEKNIIHMATKERKTAKSTEVETGGRVNRVRKIGAAGAAGAAGAGGTVETVLEQLDNEKEKLNLEVGSDSLSLTHLNKVFWPGYGQHPAITKRDYLCYLAQVSQFLIPHMTDRLITLVRFPNGITGGRFYQKHWEHRLPKFVKAARVFTEHVNKDQEFLVCNNLATLLWLGQMADLELHTSHTRITALPDAPNLSEKMTGSITNVESSIANYPDYIVLDLDPYLYSGNEKAGEEPELHRLGFKKCCQIATYLQDLLEQLQLTSFLKTSGKTGLHIYIPIERNVDYNTVRSISEIICRRILDEHGDEVTMEWQVRNRTGKVFLDHNMNARSKSLASVYSPRVSPEGSVSTPIDWSELSTVYPTDFDVRTVPGRLAERGDLWANIMNAKNDLTTAFNVGAGTSKNRLLRRKSTSRPRRAS